VRVLLLTQRLPYAPNRGDRLRAFHEIRYLRACGFTVDVCALVHDDEEATQADAMRQEGLRVEVAPVPHLRNKVAGLLALPGSLPLTLALLDSPGMAPALDRLLSGGRPDVVLAFSSSMAAPALRPPLAGIPLVLDLVDVDSEKWKALAVSSAWPLSWVYRREHRTLQAFEAHAARQAYASILTTERELQALQAFAPDVRAEVVPNGIDLERFRRPADLPCEPRVVFTGIMNYQPNADAAVWLAREIWPMVREQRPDAALDIVGAFPTAAVQALHDEPAGVTVTGSVPDVRPYLWRARVAAAPLRVARGVQNKVLEAAAAGLPSVVTSAVRAGLPASLRERCPLADSPAAIAAALVRLLAAPPEHETWTRSVADLDWASALSRLPDLLQAAAGSQRA
jgi:polysaccharide biosynthesis protein PslH